MDLSDSGEAPERGWRMTGAVGIGISVAANEGEKVWHRMFQQGRVAASGNESPPFRKVLVRTSLEQARVPEKQATPAGQDSSSSPYPLTTRSKT